MSEIKTVTEIVEEMKRRKEMLEDAAFNAPLCYSIDTMKAQCEILDEFIEMFEAAHGRELSKNASKNGADFGQLSNAAKLREVLIDVVERLEAYVGCDHHTFHPTATTCDGITSVGKCGKIGTCAAIFKGRAALAAPPRNCDRFKTAAEAWEAYDEWVESYRSKGKTPPFNEFGWLFATAKEGGDK